VGTGGDKVPSGTKEINSGRAQVVAVRKHLPSLPGLGRFVDREPSHQWLGYFQNPGADGGGGWCGAGSGLATAKRRGEERWREWF